MKTPRETPRSIRTSSRALAALVALSSVMGVACSSPPPKPALAPKVTPPITKANVEPPAPAEPKREPPPEPTPLGDIRIPSATWSELPSGLKIGAVESRSLPIVEIRAAILGGISADEGRPGLAALTAELLRTGGAGAMSGRDEIARIESLASDLVVRAELDRITLRLRVTKDLLGEAIDLLGDIIARPQLSPTAFAKIKARAMERAALSSQRDADWSASVVLFRDLFALPTDRHAYASFDATAEELSKLTAMDCRAYWGRYFVPKNTFVVVAGDVSGADAKAALAKAFSRYAGAEPPVISFTDPVPPESLKITLVDLPKSAESTVYVGMLGPERADAAFPSFAVATELLRADGADIIPLAGSPVVFYTRTKTATPQAGLALKATLDRIAALSEQPASDERIASASRGVLSALSVKLSSAGALADAVVEQRTLHLWDDAIGAYKKALLAVTPLSTAKAAAEYLRGSHAVVVAAGDAEVLGPMLSHFGEVKVVDPTKGFQRERTIPMNAAAPLKPPRESGEGP